MRVALVGLGGAAIQGHLPALRRLSDDGRLRLVAAADRASTRRRALGEAVANVPTFGSAEAMLGDVEVDVLVVATEPSAHAGLIGLGLAAGVHVVCEKPLVAAADCLAAVRAAARRSPALAVVSVHQYRYAAAWKYFEVLARTLDSLHFPFTLRVEVSRQGPADPHAVSLWRADPGSGGPLVDHGAHFVSLAATIESEITVLGAGRQRQAPGPEERSWGAMRFGSGTLDLRFSTLAQSHRTRLQLLAPPLALEWDQARIELRLAQRPVRAWSASELSDRGYLDSLYLSFYEDLTRSLRDSAWRSSRTAESLRVGEVLVELLRQAG